MLVIAFIAVFIVGMVVGCICYTLYSMHISNMSLEEMEYVGNMLLKAGNNRESRIELSIDNDDTYYYDEYILKKK